MKFLEERVTDLEHAVKDARFRADAANAATDGIWAELKEFRTETNLRFDKMDARLDKMDARFDGMDARLDKMDARFDGMDARFDGMDGRLDKMDGRFDGMESRMDRFEETQRLSNSMLQLILDEIRKR